MVPTGFRQVSAAVHLRTRARDARSAAAANAFVISPVIVELIFKQHVSWMSLLAQDAIEMLTSHYTPTCAHLGSCVRVSWRVRFLTCVTAILVAVIALFKTDASRLTKHIVNDGLPLCFIAKFNRKEMGAAYNKRVNETRCYLLRAFSRHSVPFASQAHEASG